jgi:hypothetical protein
MAKLSSMIRASAGVRELNYPGVWSKQMLSPALENQLAAIAASVFEVIVHPPEAFQNITEWCKKELCWDRVLSLQISLKKDFLAELLDGGSDRRVRRDARLQQDMDSGIDAQVKVVQLGKEFWFQLAKWSRARKLASPEEDQLLSVVIQMPRRIPTDWQSEKLLKLKTRMEAEGFSI